MEYEYLYTKGLYEKLKEKIKGRVFCKVIDNVLIVDIHTRENIDFGYTVIDFAEKMRTGQITQGSIVEEICVKFKKKVVNTFFYY